MEQQPTRDELLAAADVLPPDAVIAIDGPAGSGKSTTARSVARRLGLLHVDTGAMYRALTRAALDAGIDLQDEAALCRLQDDATLRLEPGDKEARVFWNGRDVSQAIRTPEVDAGVSPVAAHAGVRRRMVELQRSFGRRGGVVMEGRDIGSVVFPLATAKIYLDASPQARADRRWRQERERGRDLDRQDVLEDLLARDARDQGRAESPLIISPDAQVLDTSTWSLDRQLDEAVLACRLNPWLDARLDWDARGAWRAMPYKYRLAFSLFGVFRQLLGQREVGRPAPTVPRGMILASNHVSWYDPPLVGGALWRSPLRTLAKRELFRGPVGAAFFHWLDAIPINRKGYDPDAFADARAALARGDNLFLFPEGTRRPPGRLGPIRGGLGILAQETRAPILPIFARGTAAPRFGGNPEAPLELRFGPVLRLHALDRLLADLEPREVTVRIGDLFLAVLEELQARSHAEAPRTAFEERLEQEVARKVSKKRPFGEPA